MVHLMARPSLPQGRCPADTGYWPFSLLPHLCRHVPPTPLPEASVWVLKGTLKFSCIRHHLYLFLMTFLGYLHTPSIAPRPPGEKTLLQYGGQFGRILWHGLVSQEAGNPFYSPSPPAPAQEALSPDYTLVISLFCPPVFPFFAPEAVFGAFHTPNVKIKHTIW